MKYTSTKINIKNLISLILIETHRQNLTKHVLVDKDIEEISKDLKELLVIRDKEDYSTIAKGTIGNLLTLTIILAEQNNTTIKECLEIAYYNLNLSESKTKE